MYRYSIPQALQYLKLNPNKIDDNIKASLIGFLEELQLARPVPAKLAALEELLIIPKEQCKHRQLYLLNNEKCKFGLYNKQIDGFYGVVIEPYSNAKQHYQYYQWRYVNI